ncbi:amino acid ABC transporter substrate-binding protein [Candidatus Gracilibacteria bacterium]|nr:amino acid ABC transporter substrate-binding protein [Candidatus Gracilibacteria bacterium]NJM86279.1 amino acid ABC transporter substrate-binding protein [Hydrococcus sp. RU_2_2]NJP18093.1 amino acid ABC transporter substrate-binding protein [Hydrococcus sp. CRU_1_1]
MTQKILLWIVSIFFLFNPSLSLMAQEETVLQEIERSGLIKLGIREDAFPFGYKDSENNFSGICLDIFKLIVEKVRQESKREIVAIRLTESTLRNRFDLVEDKIIHIECGPNTINAATNRNIRFSNPFFVTGTQLLIRVEDKQIIDTNGSLNDLTLGVLRNTATQRLLEERYPLANLQAFQGITGRRRGVQAIRQNRIDAFASDSILLLGEANRQGLALNRDFLLIPEEPLDCVLYGLILPKNDSQWQKLVNSIINERQLYQIYRKWFGEVAPEIRKTADFCRNKSS